MPRSRPRYPAEYRQQMVDLVRSGRNPDHLAREFEPSAQSIRNWVRQAERSELRRLCRDIRRLREEREILVKQGPGSLGRRDRRGLPVHESAPG